MCMWVYVGIHTCVYVGVCVCVCACVLCIICKLLDIFCCTETGSANFTKFLELLGDKIPLEGWQHFKGGLDVKSE